MTENQEPEVIVQNFYTALQRKDISALESIIDTTFAPDVVLEVPPSLYYGGQFKGREQVKKLLTGTAHPKSPVDPESITVERMAVAEQHVVAELSFNWRGRTSDQIIRTGNMEWLTFVNGQVSTFTVLYRDTAQCVALDEGRQ